MQQLTDTHKHKWKNKNKLMNKSAIIKICKSYTYLGTCWKCNEFGHLAKECKIITSNTNQSDHPTQEQVMTNICKMYAICHQYLKSNTHKNFSNQTTSLNTKNYSRFSIIWRSLKPIKQINKQNGWD